MQFAHGKRRFPYETSTAAFEGAFFGALLVTSIAFPVILVPTAVAMMFLLASPDGPMVAPRDHWLILILTAKIGWLCFVYLNYDTAFYPFAITITSDAALFAAILMRRREEFFRGLAFPWVCLFVLDAAFNVWTFATGADPVGRTVQERPDDVIPRMGGIFGHPFASANISLVGLLFGYYLRRRWIACLAILNVLGNGTYRGVLTLLVTFSVYYLVSRRVRFSGLLVLGILIAAGVVGATYYSATLMDDTSGNIYRLFAWMNAIELIPEAPWVGHHNFDTSPMDEGGTMEGIISRGIGESPYFDYALHYGIPAALLHFLLLITIWRRTLKELDHPESTASARLRVTSAVFAGVAFIDSFYGTLVGGAFTSIVFALFVMTARHVAPPYRAQEQPVVS